MYAHPSGLIAVALSMVALASGCGDEREITDLSAPPSRSAAPATVAPPPAAEAREPARERREEPLPGLLVADRKADIGSQLTGQVTAVLAREGDPVRVNQPLIRLDDRALRLEV